MHFRSGEVTVNRMINYMNNNKYDATNVLVMLKQLFSFIP